MSDNFLQDNSIPEPGKILNEYSYSAQIKLYLEALVDSKQILIM